MKNRINFTLALLILFFLSGCGIKKEVVKKEEEKKFLQDNTVDSVKGRVVFEQYEFAENAFVYLYKSITDFPDKPFLISNPTDKDGNWKFEKVEDGRYFIISVKRKTGLSTGPIENGDYFSYFAANPIDIMTGKSINVNIVLGQKIIPAVRKTETEDKNKSGIKGKILSKGSPVNSAYAFVIKSTDYYFKGPANYLSLPTDGDGNFSIELPEGSYYLMAKKKISQKINKKSEPTRKNEAAVITEFKEIEEFAGPLETDDYYCYYDENPIKVEKGFYYNVVLNCINKIGDKDKGYSVLTDTRIEGKIIDKNGNPVEGIYAFAHKGFKTNIEKPRPEFISKKTGKDGKFVFNFIDGGLYYIGAREVLGRIPKAGDLYGYYVSKDKDNAIFIKKSEVIKDITIKVSPIE